MVFDPPAICIQNLCVENFRLRPENAPKQFYYKIINLRNILQKSE